MLHTWPLATAPARLSRNDNADTQLNEWIVAWIEHQGVRNALKLFHANIFYPEPRTLAYSEYLIVPAAMGAPARAAGASPVLVYNLLLLAGFTLTGWAGYLLISRWTGDDWAGLITGTMLAFNAHTLTRLPQLQAQHMEFLPLALLAFDQLLGDGSGDGFQTRPQTRPRLPRLRPWLAIWVALQGLTSYYGLLFTVTALAVGWLVRYEDWRSGRAKEHIALVAAASVLALAVLAPVLIPYARLGQVRPIEEVAAYSAGARDYLATPARIHYDTWSARFFGGTTALFPGATALVLASVAIATGVAWRDRRARMALAFGVAGVALSFGPAMPGYTLLYQWLPPLRGIRNAARFGYLAIVAAAVLAGFAVAWIRTRWFEARWPTALAAVILVAANLDAFAGPIEYVDAERVSPLHAALRGSTAIVVEVPAYPVDRVFRNAPYLVHSTEHWRPMVNGYSGLTPDSYVQHARDLARFPDDHSIDALRALGVTHVFVHDRALRDWTDDETADAVPRSSRLELIGRDGELALYRIR